MLHISTLTKKGLENVVKKIFKIFGPYYSSQALDSLKFLGFSYATSSGISINIEDLKVPLFKRNSLKKASKDISIISKGWRKGKLTEIERFASIINNWGITSEMLKNKIINYFKSFEPTNNLYIMAFSGARGNMDQVRQIIGIRGLMSDQEGQIIDLPICNNFREGLSPIDYVISSYGARKGIVDTALKTASSGYLTRRLVYVAQDLIIRKFDCKTNKGIFLFINKKTNVNDMQGRILLSVMPLKHLAIKITNKNIYLNVIMLEYLRNSPTLLSIRSPLTCAIKDSICQSCYGLNLAKNKLINLGDAVGIIAAHSLGEPATQLTMRTFHTGGVFTNESLKQLSMPFSGKIKIPIKIKKNIFKNFFGNPTYKMHKPLIVTIKNWEGKKKSLIIESGSVLSIIKTKFIKKYDLISERPPSNKPFSMSKKTPIYSNIAGEVHITKKKKRLKSHRIFSRKIVLIKSGKILISPKSLMFHHSDNYKANKPIASLNIVCPVEGFFLCSKKKISIISKKKKISIKFFNLYNFFKDYKIKLLFYLYNYQFIERFTLFGSFNFYFRFQESLYKVKKLCLNLIYFKIHLLVIRPNIWKIFLDQNRNLIPKLIYELPNQGTTLNQIIKSGVSGFLIKKDGHNLTYQKIYSINLNKKINLKIKTSAFIFKNKVLFNASNPAQATLDITQGLPKLEGIFEARIVKKKLTLAEWPGVFLTSSAKKFSYDLKFGEDTIIFDFKKNFVKNLNQRSKTKNLKILHTKHNLKHIIFYKNEFWSVSLLPKGFFPIETRKRNKKPILEFIKNKSILCIITLYRDYPSITSRRIKKLKSKWSANKINETNMFHYKNVNLNRKQLGNEKVFKDILYYYTYDKSDDLVFKIKKNKYIYLRPLHCLKTYNANHIYSNNFRLGLFIDIAEPISFFESIDPRNVLEILFNYHIFLDGIIIGTIKSVNKFQLILINSIQAIYQSQNIDISSKNVDIIIRQLTNKLEMIDGGGTPYIPGETYSIMLMLEVIKIVSINKHLKIPVFQPKFFSSIYTSLNKTSFLAAASFQQPRKILSKATIHGKNDWLIGLKERIVASRYISSGSTFLNNTKNLDTVYLFKKK